MSLFALDHITLDGYNTHLPPELRHGRQFITARVEPGGKNSSKIPVDHRGKAVNALHPDQWVRLEDALDTIDRGVGNCLGLILPESDRPGYNLLTNIVAIDADAKHDPTVQPFTLPDYMLPYIERFRTYTEVSPSGKGQRSLLFGTVNSTAKQIKKVWSNGHASTEMEIFYGGQGTRWVTLTGLRLEQFGVGVMHRQAVLDEVVAEFEVEVKTRKTRQAAPRSASDRQLRAVEDAGAVFDGSSSLAAAVADWQFNPAATVTDEEQEQFLLGWNRTEDQRIYIDNVWNFRFGQRSGDASFHLKHLLKECICLGPRLKWPVQKAVDIVAVWARRHSLGPDRVNERRIRHAIEEAFTYVLATSKRVQVYTDFYGEHVIAAYRLATDGPARAEVPVVSHPFPEQRTSTETGPAPDPAPVFAKSTAVDMCEGPTNKCEGASLGHEHMLAKTTRRQSRSRDAVLSCLSARSGWVGNRIIAKKTGLSTKATLMQLGSLVRKGVVERGGRGKYRLIRQRRSRALKRCAAKPFPLNKFNRPCHSLTRTQLQRRGWPRTLIDHLLPEPSETHPVCLPNGSTIVAKCYFVSDISALEHEDWFDNLLVKFRDEERSKPRPTTVILQALEKANGPVSLHELSTATSIQRHVITTVIASLRARLKRVTPARAFEA